MILPTYNRRESLRRCLQGLLACDLGGVSVEVRVVDDGSTDGTAEMVREMETRAPKGARLAVLRQANGGCCQARNRGMEGAETDLLLFIDDDCVPEKGWLLGLVNAPWEEGLGGVGGRIVSPEVGTVVSRYCRYIHFDEYPPAGGRAPITYVNTASCAFLRRAVEEVGGFEPSLSGGGPDLDLSARVARQGYTLHYAPEAGVVHYHRETWRALARAYRKRGARHLLRKLYWGLEPPPSPGGTLREGLRLLLGNARLLILPLSARRLARRGVPPRDALAFALLEWLRHSATSWGRVCMMGRILAGSQEVERLFPLPPATAARCIAPATGVVAANSTRSAFADFSVR